MLKIYGFPEHGGFKGKVGGSTVQCLKESSAVDLGMSCLETPPILVTCEAAPMLSTLAVVHRNEDFYLGKLTT